MVKNARLWCLTAQLWFLDMLFSNCVKASESLFAKSCLTLCNPMVYSPPGSSVHGIFQERILEWVVMPFSRRPSQPGEWTQVSLGLSTSDEIPEPEATGTALHSWFHSSWCPALNNYTQGGKEMPSERCSGTELQDTIRSCRGFPGGSAGKESPNNAGDPSLIPESGRFPREGNGNPLQYSCLENLMDRGAWQATDHGVAKSQTWLSNWTELNQKKKKSFATNENEDMFMYLNINLSTSLTL